MELVCFEIGSERFPVYRTLSPEEGQILRALLGTGFQFPLTDGDPLDALLFEVLATVGMRADFYFTPPVGSSLLGTFELRDERVPAPPDVVSGPRRLRRTLH